MSRCLVVLAALCGLLVGCGDDKVCDEGGQGFICESQADCREGLNCRERPGQASVCQIGCFADADCPEGQTCGQGGCSADELGSGFTCD